MSCTYCDDGADHEAVDHRDPARAIAVADRYESAGDPSRARLWREVARRRPQRRTTPTKLTVELVAAWLTSPIERGMLRGFADVAAARAVPLHLGWGFYGTASGAGLRVDCQEQHGRYTLDFVLRAGHRPVVVECDGHEFHQKTKAQVAKDRARDRYFVERGFIVIRYTGSEIRRNARLCAEQAIAIAMNELVR